MDGEMFSWPKLYMCIDSLEFASHVAFFYILREKLFEGSCQKLFLGDRGQGLAVLLAWCHFLVSYSYIGCLLHWHQKLDFYFWVFFITIFNHVTSTQHYILVIAE